MTIFFIGGCMRSGTTLLNSILCSDTSTNPAIAEIQYVTHLMHHYHWGQRHFNLYLKDTFEDLESFKAFTAGWLNDYLRRTEERWQPCDHLVLKNPELVHYFPNLLELVDGAKFFLTVRDPRDTVVSMRSVARKQREQGISSTLTKMNDDARLLARHYQSYYLRLLRGDMDVLQSNLFLVRYEDLVTQPEAVVAKMRDFTGLALADYNPESEWQRNVEDFDQSRTDRDRAPWTTDLHGKGVSSSRIGQFRDSLGAEEIAVVEEECQAIMRAFAYKPFAEQTPPA